MISAVPYFSKSYKKLITDEKKKQKIKLKLIIIKSKTIIHYKALLHTGQNSFLSNQGSRQSR
jgi:hypothetical protein